jgi:membrane protease YdiL (CAAX protease family)
VSGVLVHRVAGVLALGGVPLLLMPWAGLDGGPVLAVRLPLEGLAWIGLSALVIPVVMRRAARDPRVLRDNPKMLPARTTPAIVAVGLGSWLGYLIAYELFFRGVLLMGAWQAAPLGVALTLQVAIYAGAHVAQGRRVALASIPFALVLSLITIRSGSVVTAIVIHTLNAWIGDLYFVRADRRAHASHPGGEHDDAGVGLDPVAAVDEPQPRSQAQVA